MSHKKRRANATVLAFAFIAMLLSSCFSLPYSVENASPREIRLILVAESSVFLKLEEEGILLGSLKDSRSDTCAPGERIRRFKYDETEMERYIDLPPMTRVCFLTRLEIDAIAERILILDKQRSVSVKDRFRYYRTTWDVPGKVFVYEEKPEP